MTKLLSLILSLFAAIMNLFNPLPQIKPMEIEYDPEFNTVLRFVVSSDSHVKKFGDIGCERIMKMIATGSNAAKADAAHPTLDAAVMVGDITNFGLPTAFFSVKAAVSSVLEKDTDFLAIAAKNHDGYLGRISRAYAAGISEDGADFHKVINGYHFIGLSASADIFVHYSDKQIKWLDKQLAEAAADDPEKPIFVFQHEHIAGTVYGSLSEDGWGVDFLTETLSKYPQVVDISGHSHYPANDPRSIWQGAFTALNDGGLSYYEFTVDGHNSQHPESSDNMAHMLLVEVDDQNRVKVRVCDLNAEAVLAEYMIDNISETAKTKYSHETRRLNASAPVFESDLKASVNGNTVSVTSSPAKAANDDVVFIYRAAIINENGDKITETKKLGDYYKSSAPADIGFSFTIEEPGSYTAVLTAEDAWGKASEPIKADFTI